MRDSGHRRSPRRSRSRLAAFLVATVVLFCASAAWAQENADCLKCHEDPALRGTRGGQEISVHVDPKVFAGSVHAKQQCVFCHQDLEDAEFPHAKDVAPVDCSVCHESQAEHIAASLHGSGDEMAPTCADCHGTHDIRRSRDPAARTAVVNIPGLCGTCHHEGTAVSRTHDIPQDRILENYSEGMHGAALFRLHRKGLPVSPETVAVCTSCHTAHDVLPHTDPKSTIHHDNVVGTCTKCHSQIERVHRKVIGGEMWEKEPHKVPVCVDCHAPHKIRRVYYDAGTANDDCLECHREPKTMTRDGRTVSIQVDEVEYSRSAHSGTACAQCHSTVNPALDRPCETATARAVDCSVCHEPQVAQYQKSTHGQIAAKGGVGASDAPKCGDCHVKHATKSRKQPDSPTFPRNVPTLCAKCHALGEKAERRIGHDFDVFKAYSDSIHGIGLTESGLLVTATCTSCHTAHGELPPSDPGSTVHPDQVAKTCGQCHHGIMEQFKTSVHATADVKPGRTLPSCKDCHSSHTISRTDKDDFRTRMTDQCGRCHEAEAETFFETFHGKVSRLGTLGAAKCYDCHGTHGILPPSDPASTLGRDNVVQTCGKCHGGSHRRFAGYLTHATHHDPEKYPWLFWAFWGMTTLLVGTLVFGVFHTAAWLLRLWLTREQWRAHKVASAAAAAAATAAGDQKLYRRFTRKQRTLHLIMLISFFTLALTGMTIKFADVGWAQWLSAVLGGFKTTGMLHRLSAITLVTIFVIHLWDVRRHKKESGRTWLGMIFGPDSMMLTRRDLTEFVESMKWFFGVGPRPRYGRWTYWEKFDYLAVFWGVFIIGSTGLVLWFPEIFTHVIPGWFVNVATIIHSDEALLAVAFIFTIHFFNTHFRPDKFPMDPVIFTGRVTVDELKYDKPREYEALVAAGKLEEHLVAPFPKPVEKGFKIFGFAALAVGLTLIVAIMYAMLFHYT